jgi:hypothetical protein
MSAGENGDFHIMLTCSADAVAGMRRRAMFSLLLTRK